ncbi:MAG TPA: GNAT family N-acetyltransferase [Terriglobales bacterium]|jgi:RimJ/RimL family protein N-acetyltransferase
MPLPTLQTARLILRTFELKDVPDIVRLAGAREVAATTLRIPHPYSDKDAETFVAAVRRKADENQAAVFAIESREGAKLVGAVGLEIQEPHRHAELGYWIGVPYWGHGYATEAARAALRFGFHNLGLNRIYAMHFVENLRSGQVLRKIGMRHEGCMRQHVMKWDRFHDLEYYAILRSDPFPEDE